jgi:hypothetical protein
VIRGRGILKIYRYASGENSEGNKVYPFKFSAGLLVKEADTMRSRGTAHARDTRTNKPLISILFMILPVLYATMPDL